LFVAVAKNNVHLAIQNGESGRPTVTAVFSVIPANAGFSTGTDAGAYDLVAAGVPARHFAAPDQSQLLTSV
jgi:hypothetical protein